MNYSRLKLTVQEPLKLKDLSYKFVVINYSTQKKTNFEGRFDEQGLTEWYEIHNSNTLLIYEILFRGELLQRVSAKAYPDQKKHSTYILKVTTAITKNVKENVKEIYLNDGEVAWYLVKKTETMLDWSKRIFKKPLVASDWDTLRANNPHLKNIAPIKLLTPGQVVVLSNSTTAKALPQYKKDAQEAQNNLDKMTKDKDFDAIFFAQNYEFFHDALLDNRTEMSNKNIFENNDHPLVQKFDNNSNDSGAAWGTGIKGGIDAAMSFSEGVTTKIYKIHGEIALKLAEERRKGSALANPKNFKAFRKKYAHLYDELNRESTKKLFKWDQSIKTNNMRRMISQSVLARGVTYKGGIKEYIEKMGEIGKMSKYLKGGGYLFLAIDVYNAGDEIANAKPEERTRTAVVETSKIAAGLGTGAIVSFIVLGLATGGAGWVALGVVAGIGAGASWGIGELAGKAAGIAYDEAEVYWNSN
ncbi:hypothetical protein [Acinetobacter rongchengensis]